jgi:hypothetical protein
MKSLIEFLIYTIFVILFYRTIYPKINEINKNSNNNNIINYNKNLKKFEKKRFLYNLRCNKNNYANHIINYDNYIYKGQAFYGIKHGCGIETYYDKNLNEIKYEGIWVNNTENGFGILYKKNITISGNKKNNKYDGLIKFQSDLFPNDLFPNDLFPNTLIKRVDCIFVYGIQKYCFVIFMNNEYNYIPEYYIEKYNFNIAL